MKLHPLSVPYRGLSRAISLGSLAFFLGAFGAGVGPFEEPLAVLPLAALGFLVGFGWEVAYYRRFEYELTVDTLDIASGVVSRRHRDIPVGRVQNVDISRNVLQRALGIAVVEFETAGGGSSEAVLRYVGYDEAKRLQRELRRRKEGVGEARDAAGEPVAEPTVEPAGETLFELSNAELLLLSAVSFDRRVLAPLVFVVGPLLGTGMGGFSDPLSALALFVNVFAAAVLVVTAWALSAAATFARYYGFRLTRVGDELQYERGLVQRYDGSIPIEKVQTVALNENVLKRWLGYATLAVETAGYAPGQSPSGGSEAAVPLVARDRGLALARSIEPFGDLDLDFERPPRRAWRRYAVRYGLALVGLTAVLRGVWWYFAIPNLWYAPLALVPLAPVAAHYKWASRGYHVGGEHVATRNGFWRRTTNVVPYYRTQTVIESATVFQRRWRLASVVVDTAGSRSLLGQDAAAVDVDRETAAELRDVVVEGLRESRIRRRSTRRSGWTDGDPSDRTLDQ
jgi:putative membrane protein